MKFYPLKNTVVVKLDGRKTVTDSGIFVGESNDRTRRGVVVAVGPGKRLADGSFAGPSVAVDDVVLFEKSHASAEFEGTTYFFVKEDQISAVFEK